MQGRVAPHSLQGNLDQAALLSCLPPPHLLDLVDRCVTEPADCSTPWIIWGIQIDTILSIISGRVDERLAQQLRQDKHLMLKCLQRLFLSPMNKRVTHIGGGDGGII